MPHQILQSGTGLDGFLLQDLNGEGFEDVMQIPALMASRICFDAWIMLCIQIQLVAHLDFCVSIHCEIGEQFPTHFVLSYPFGQISRCVPSSWFRQPLTNWFAAHMTQNLQRTSLPESSSVHCSQKTPKTQ